MLLKQPKSTSYNRLTYQLNRLVYQLNRLVYQLAPQRYDCCNSKNEVVKNAKRLSRDNLIAQKNIGGLFARQFFCLNEKKNSS